MEFSALLSDLSFWLPAAAGYAEIHYRFPFSGSRYFMREPEIIFDAPYRVAPEKSLSVFLIVKDAHRYPVTLERVVVKIRQYSEAVLEQQFSLNTELQSHWFSREFVLPTNQLTGPAEVDAVLHYRINGKSGICRTHNLRQLEPKAMTVYFGDSNLPGNTFSLAGDLHCHTRLTEDMVEFGAPLSITRSAADNCGLTFLAAADHSYDLDDFPGSWTDTDPRLRKWHDSRTRIKQLNSEASGAVILPGEELSLFNGRRRIVHGLILNSDRFYSGRGDGAEKWFDFHCEHDVESVRESLPDSALFIAAHPSVPVPFFQWLFIKRGQWRERDLKSDAVTGFQILNGSLDAGFFRGREIWIKLLLQGFRKFIYGGTDAHGNFNKFRQIKTPMLSLHESDDQVFGTCWTAVLKDSSTADCQSILNALKTGRCYVSNGPAVKTELTAAGGKYQMGAAAPFGNAIDAAVSLFCESTREFGPLEEIVLYKGDLNQQHETAVFQEKPDEETYSLEVRIQQNGSRNCYFRAEVKTKSDRGNHMALSNPIWIEPGHASND